MSWMSCLRGLEHFEVKRVNLLRPEPQTTRRGAGREGIQFWGGQGGHPKGLLFVAKSSLSPERTCDERSYPQPLHYVTSCTLLVSDKKLKVVDSYLSYSDPPVLDIFKRSHLTYIIWSGVPQNEGFRYLVVI